MIRKRGLAIILGFVLMIGSAALLTVQPKIVFARNVSSFEELIEDIQKDITEEDRNEIKILYDRMISLEKEEKKEEAEQIEDQIYFIIDIYEEIDYIKEKSKGMENIISQEEKDKIHNMCSRMISLGKEDKKEEVEQIWEQVKNMIEQYDIIYGIRKDMHHLEEALSETEENRMRKMYNQAIELRQKDQYEQAECIWIQLDHMLDIKWEIDCWEKSLSKEEKDQIEALYEQAVQLFDEEKYEEAEQVWNKAKSMLNIYHQDDEFEKEMEKLKEIISQEQRNQAEDLYQKVVELQKQGMYEDADEMWYQLDEMCELYSDMYQFKKFIREIKEKIPQERWVEIQKLYEQVETLEKENKYEEAISACRQLYHRIDIYKEVYEMIERNPKIQEIMPKEIQDTIQTLQDQAMQFQNQEEYEESYEICDKIRQIIDVYKELVEIKECIDDLNEKLTKEELNEIQTLYDQVDDIIQESKYEEAKELIHQLHDKIEECYEWEELELGVDHLEKEDKQKAKVLVEEISFLNAQGDYTKAEQVITQLKNLIDVDCEIDCFKREIDDCKKGMSEEDGNKVDALYNEALKLKKQGKYEEAVERCNEGNQIIELYSVYYQILELKAFTDRNKEIMPQETISKVEPLFIEAINFKKQNQYKKELEVWEQLYHIISPYDEAVGMKEFLESLKDSISEEEMTEMKEMCDQLIYFQKHGENEKFDSVKWELSERMCLYEDIQEFKKLKDIVMNEEDSRKGEELCNEAIALQNKEKYDESSDLLEELEQIIDKYFTIRMYKDWIQEVEQKMSEEDLVQVKTLYHKAIPLVKQEKQKEAYKIWEKMNCILEKYE